MNWPRTGVCDECWWEGLPHYRHFIYAVAGSIDLALGPTKKVSMKNACSMQSRPFHVLYLITDEMGRVAVFV